jgi:hypothetical protein
MSGWTAYKAEAKDGGSGIYISEIIRFKVRRTTVHVFLSYPANICNILHSALHLERVVQRNWERSKWRGQMREEAINNPTTGRPGAISLLSQPLSRLSSLKYVVLFSSGIISPSDFLFMLNTVFWDVTSCGSCKNRRFGGPCTLIIDAIRSYET